MLNIKFTASVIYTAYAEYPFPIILLPYQQIYPRYVYMFSAIIQHKRF